MRDIVATQQSLPLSVYTLRPPKHVSTRHLIKGTLLQIQYYLPITHLHSSSSAIMLLCGTNGEILLIFIHIIRVLLNHRNFFALALQKAVCLGHVVNSIYIFLGCLLPTQNQPHESGFL